MSDCPRCGTHIPASGWWRSLETVDGPLVDVCVDCGSEIDEEPVDPSAWKPEEETGAPDVGFQPATEVYTGP